MRSAGIFQIEPGRSISDQRASIASLVLQAVRITKRSASTGKRRHELWGFGIGQGRMMANDTLRPLGQLFAQLLRQLGWIAKIKVVDVYVARDDGFDPPANTAGGHPLLDPDWLQQIMDMTR